MFSSRSPRHALPWVLPPPVFPAPPARTEFQWFLGPPVSALSLCSLESLGGAPSMLVVTVLSLQVPALVKPGLLWTPRLS